MNKLTYHGDVVFNVGKLDHVTWKSFNLLIKMTYHGDVVSNVGQLDHMGLQVLRGVIVEGSLLVHKLDNPLQNVIGGVTCLRILKSVCWSVCLS